MKTIKTVCLFFLISFICSCSQEVKNKEFINKLSTIQNGLPSPYFNFYLYFKTDSDKIIETNVDVLYELYKNNYSNKYKKFENYLEALFLQKEMINVNEINILKEKNYTPINIVLIDKEIEKMTLEEIEKKYLKRENQNFVLTTNTVNLIQTKTILYKMFLENYIISLNDYVGYYKITKYNEKDFK